MRDDVQIECAGDPKATLSGQVGHSIGQPSGVPNRWNWSAAIASEGMKVLEVIKRLEADIRSKGGHRQFKHAVKKGRVTVAGQLNVDVPIKTLRSIWKQAQLPEVD